MSAPKRPEPMRQLKIEAERVREKLQKSIIDNPQTARKAALLISLWINDKAKKQTSKKAA